jgi:hypothetical protein
VLAHRLQLAHRTGGTARQDVITQLLADVAVPD